MVRVIRRRAFLKMGASVLGVIGLPRLARGGVAEPVSLRRLVLDSACCVRGVAREVRSEWRDLAGSRRIVSTSRVVVQDVMGGPALSEVLVNTLGGRVGHVGQVVHGEALLLLNEPCLLFLTPSQNAQHYVAHFAQGHFPLRRRSGRLRLASSPRSPALTRAQPGAAAALLGLDVDVAVARIRGEYARANP